jgi:hypothetical protein
MLEKAFSRSTKGAFKADKLATMIPSIIKTGQSLSMNPSRAEPR